MLGVAGYAAAVCEGSAMRTLSPQSRRRPGTGTHRQAFTERACSAAIKHSFTVLSRKKHRELLPF